MLEPGLVGPEVERVLYNGFRTRYYGDVRSAILQLKMQIDRGVTCPCPPLSYHRTRDEPFGATSSHLLVEQPKALVIADRIDLSLQFGSVSELAKRGRNHVFARIAVGVAVKGTQPSLHYPACRTRAPLINPVFVMISRLVITDGGGGDRDCCFCPSHGGAAATLDRGL
jgi:hypothetical protein